MASIPGPRAVPVEETATTTYRALGLEGWFRSATVLGVGYQAEVWFDETLTEIVALKIPSHGRPYDDRADIPVRRWDLKDTPARGAERMLVLQHVERKVMAEPTRVSSPRSRCNRSGAGPASAPGLPPRHPVWLNRVRARTSRAS